MVPDTSKRGSKLETERSKFKVTSNRNVLVFAHSEVMHTGYFVFVKGKATKRFTSLTYRERKKRVKLKTRWTVNRRV